MTNYYRGSITGVVSHSDRDQTQNTSSRGSPVADQQALWERHDLTPGPEAVSDHADLAYTAVATMLRKMVRADSSRTARRPLVHLHAESGLGGRFARHGGSPVDRLLKAACWKP